MEEFDVVVAGGGARHEVTATYGVGASGNTGQLRGNVGERKHGGGLAASQDGMSWSVPRSWPRGE